jgi:CRP/FNR family transcriptional regulator
MSSALQDEEYEMTAEAIEPTQVRVLRTSLFKQMVQEFADAGLGAAKALAKDYRAAFDEACLIALPGSPAGRLARLILDWPADAKHIGPQRFRKEKLISIRGVALTVLQPRALEQLSAC